MPDRILPPEVTEDIRALLTDAGVTANQDLVARIIATGVGLGLDDTDRLDLKITSAALTEMRAAFRLFAPYRDVPKVTIFGSARTRPDDALYRAAVDVAAALAARGWFVVTGAGRMGGCGNAVRIDHGGALQTRYCHMSSIASHTGQFVRRGQVIAASGNSGRVYLPPDWVGHKVKIIRID